MAEENEGLLAYFQRSMSILLSQATSDSGIMEVKDEYSAFIILDAIERIFQHGRKTENALSWEVLKAGVDNAPNLDLLLATHTRSLERQTGLSPQDKSRRFFEYTLLNKMLSNFCTSLSKNSALLEKFYFPGHILTSAEHMAMFALQLTTLESLNFKAIWGSPGAMSSFSDFQESKIPQKTVVSRNTPPTSLQLPNSASNTSSSSLKTAISSQSTSNLSFNGKERESTNSNVPVRQSPDLSNPFASYNNGPLTFSLNRKYDNHNTTIEQKSSPSTHDILFAKSFGDDSPTVSKSPFSSALSTASVDTHNSTTQISSQTIAPTSSEIPVNNDQKSEASTSNPSSFKSSEPSLDYLYPKHQVVEDSELPLAAVEPSAQAQPPSATLPGSSKKRPKKRTIEL